MTQAITTRGSHALAPSEYRLQFGSITDKGYEFDEGVELTPDLVKQEGERIAKGYEFIDKSRPFVIGTFVRASELKVGEMASQVYDIFGMKFQRLKNVLYVVDNVPKDLWNPEIAFDIHYEVANLKDQPKDQAALLAMAAEGTIGTNGERRPLTVAEFKTAKKTYLSEIAKTGEAAAPGVPEEKQPAFHFSFSFRAPEPKEAIKDYVPAAKKEAVAQFDEALKCYTQPKYAAQKAERERKDAFKTLMGDVPPADQAQFAELFAQGVPIAGIKGAVKKYKEVQAAADALDKLLETIPEDHRDRFREKVASGVSIKDVKAEADAFLKKEGNRTAVQEALNTQKIVKPEDRNKFLAMLDGETPKKLSDIKAEIRAAGKTLRDNEKRLADIETVLEGISAEDREQFQKAIHEGASAKSIREDVNAWKAELAQTNKKKYDKNKEDRKEWRAQAANKLRSANVLREGNTPEDLERAAVLEQEAQALLEKADKSEQEDNAERGIVAHPKPTKGGGAAKNAKKGSKKGKKAKKS